MKLTAIKWKKFDSLWEVVSAAAAGREKKEEGGRGCAGMCRRREILLTLQTRARRSSQSAKQLRIYLTPSQAIKHFSFIHGRCRAVTHAIPATHERDTSQPDTDTFSPMPAAAAVAVAAALLLLLASCSARQNNSHIWHATCLCFWPWVIDDHANDQ